ncbi:uncharacterized protein LOC128963664 [Oppia nitens]|uniref:uncharacterized protein LOC128963664 n=1 Tax=Oppia nitens TaxID=1686743 RepID=UPI0023DC4FD0|nr:uncharacterized protein LOC128963664 [Oppia nitens]
MLKITILALLALSCNAQYGMAPTQLSAPAPLPLAAPVNSYAAPTQSYAAPTQSYAAPAVQQYTGPIEAAVQTRRTVELRQVAIPSSYAQPQVIDVNSDNMPVQINFRSSSSRIQVHQTHTPSQGSVEHSSFQDQPHRLINEVTKPIYQEVREVIQPYRRITQEIRPVIEEIHTVVHKGERVAAAAAPVVQPLPLQTASYGSGAALAVNAQYKAAKAAKAAA